MSSGLPLMSFEDQCVVRGHLDQRSTKAQEESGLRSFNLSRYAAKEYFNAANGFPNEEGCPEFIPRHISD